MCIFCIDHVTFNHVSFNYFATNKKRFKQMKNLFHGYAIEIALSYKNAKNILCWNGYFYLLKFDIYIFTLKYLQQQGKSGMM